MAAIIDALGSLFSLMRGTPKRNRRGRPKGGKNSTYRFSARNDEIRMKALTGANVQDLAKEYGISKQRVCQITGRILKSKIRRLPAIKAALERGEDLQAVQKQFSVSRAFLIKHGLIQKKVFLYKQHGNFQAYNRGCRCGPCRAANTARCVPVNRKRNERLKLQGLCIRCKQPSDGYVVCLTCQPNKTGISRWDGKSKYNLHLMGVGEEMTLRIDESNEQRIRNSAFEWGRDHCQKFSCHKDGQLLRVKRIA